MTLEARRADHASLAREFAETGLVRDLFGFLLDRVAPGLAEMSVAYREELGTIPGLFHGAVITSLAECAASCAASTLLPDGMRAVILEQSIKFVAPAKGEKLIAIGKGVASGRSVGTMEADVYAVSGTETRLCAKLQLTCFHLLA